MAARRSTTVMLGCMFAASTAYATDIPRATPESAGMSTARLAAVARKMDALVDGGAFPGMTAIIARQGSVVFQHSTGLLDVETDAPMQHDSLLRIYSMTKPMTSVAAMMLVEDGDLLLDAPVTRFFPEWEGLAALVDGERVALTSPVTTRHLLMHTSGLTYGYYGDTPVDRMYREARLIDDWDYLTVDTHELVQKLADIPLLFQPGSRWHYGFSSDVLGHLVERVSGKTLDAFLEERLFAPLGMAGYFDVPPEVVHRFGTNHYVTDGEAVVQDSPRDDPEFIDVTFLSGGGGLVMTAEDYLRFGLMMLHRGQLRGTRVLSPTTVDLMTTNLLPAGSSASGAGFGLGFAIVQPGADRDARTPGSYYWGGAAGTFFWIDPAYELVAVFMPQRIGTPGWIQTTLQNMVYAAIDQ